jgi:hypothetical protein
MSDQGNQGNPPYGQPGQYGPPPGQYGGPQWQPRPPKSNRGLILGLGGAGVLALVILAFTAFVSPGFLTGDDEPTAAAPSNSPTPERSHTPSAGPSLPDSTEPPPAMRKMATDFVTGLNAGDKAATGVICANSKQRLTEVFDRYVRYKAKLKVDSTSGSANAAILRLSGTMRGEPAQGMVLVSDLSSAGDPCLVTFYVISN